MSAPDTPWTLPGWDGEVVLWLEPDTAVMLVAHTAPHHDPVELTAADARRLAAALTRLADALEPDEAP
ncbi:MAG: hypothetical protein H6737_18695 [Alphaproteobacteria bacterium]|nr:hypothetical protein [Alphaproteobacteria bacterium]